LQRKAGRQKQEKKNGRNQDLQRNPAPQPTWKIFPTPECLMMGTDAKQFSHLDFGISSMKRLITSLAAEICVEVQRDLRP
jgi:hypothetical protein